MIRVPLAAIVLALMAALAVIQHPTPASAGGRVSFTITPKEEGADAIRGGLRLYSYARDMRNRARVDQRGRGNGAGISQSGSGNWAGIFQRGRDHSATVTQNGNNNALGVFQFGRKTSTTATQTGNGNAGLVLQGGW